MAAMNVQLYASLHHQITEGKGREKKALKLDIKRQNDKSRYPFLRSVLNSLLK